MPSAGIAKSLASVSDDVSISLIPFHTPPPSFPEREGSGEQGTAEASPNPRDAPAHRAGAAPSLGLLTLAAERDARVAAVRARGRDAFDFTEAAQVAGASLGCSGGRGGAGRAIFARWAGVRARHGGA